MINILCCETLCLSVKCKCVRQSVCLSVLFVNTCVCVCVISFDECVCVWLMSVLSCDVFIYLYFDLINTSYVCVCECVSVSEGII